MSEGFKIAIHACNWLFYKRMSSWHCQIHCLKLRLTIFQACLQILADSGTQQALHRIHESHPTNRRARRAVTGTAPSTCLGCPCPTLDVWNPTLLPVDTHWQDVGDDSKSRPAPHMRAWSCWFVLTQAWPTQAREDFKRSLPPPLTQTNESKGN